MRVLSICFHVAKLGFALLWEFIRLNIASRRSKRAFRRTLRNENLPVPVIRELAKEYDSMKKQVYSLMKNLSSRNSDPDS